jgi:NAD(P)-dependent dehydrogenase (short-subunit alcohol dehydrogenase family)
MLREPVAPRIVYPEDGSVQPVRRLVWRPVPIAAPGERRLDALAGRRVVVLGDRGGAADGIAEALRRHGVDVVTEVPTEPGSVDGIVDLNVEQPWDSAKPDAWREPLRRTVAALKACYGEWIQETDCTRRFYVAVTSLGGSLGCGEGTIDQPLGGIWLGLAKTVPRELPNCNVKVLDLAAEERPRVAEILLDELYHWGLFEIGYRGGRRYMLVPESQEVPSPNIELGPEDTILISGGSRGIGYALARGLAEEFGCRVVVTGRSPLPHGDEPWIGLDEAEYKQYELGVLKSPAPGQTVADARRGLERIRQLRELAANFDDVRDAGLPIEYAACDFNEPAQIRALVEQIGSSLTGVVHNASVSAPTRLPGKTIDSFFATVDTKVGGFLRLFEAVSDVPLKFFCNVGSLVGRWGGMIGEIDYSSANAGLAVAGAWADERAAFPVMTVSWPTWEKLGGMIKNFDVTLNYTSALHVEEGVYRWKQELLAAPSGEAVFVGRVGKALFPVHVKAFPASTDLPNIGELYSYLHYLGEARRFQPFHSIESRSVIRPDEAPCMHDFRVGGSPALPVSLLLEYALSVGEWVQPEPPAQLLWHEVRDAEGDLRALALDGDELTIVKRGVGTRGDGEWTVGVELHVEDRKLARLEIVYRADEPEPGPEVHIAPSEEVSELVPAPPLEWKGLVYRLARWRRTGDGTMVGEVRRAEPSDLWATSFVPEAVLPSAQLENIFRVAAAIGVGNDAVHRLRLARVKRFARTGESGAAVGNAQGGNWAVLDVDGRTLLQLEGLGYD